MTITHVTPENQKLLQEVADSLSAAKRMVAITGAGISTSCGIPDFRSRNGLYSLINSDYNSGTQLKGFRAHGHLKGKDLFDASLWKDERSTSVFYTFIASLRHRINEEVKETSATHKFIRRIRDHKKLVRCYTQNVDGLEVREGLRTDLTRGKGVRGRFTKGAMDLPNQTSHNVQGGKLDGGCEVVQLHGDLKDLRCTICQQTAFWGQSHQWELLQGQAPVCPTCEQEDEVRRACGKRSTAVGTLRPNVVLYGEENPASDLIGRIVSSDLTFNPDLLLIMGTSLKVHGLKILVKEFAKAVHSRKGKVIFVNLSRPAESAWKEVIDYWVEMDCDTWARDKFVKKQMQIPFKSGKKKTTAKFLVSEEKENTETPTVSRVVSKNGSSQFRSPQKALPTPPPSGRRALSDRTSESDRRRLFAETPTTRAGAIILNTPSTASTPRKKRKLGVRFKIWEDRDDTELEEVADSYDELSDGLLSSPSSYRKRKLV